MSNPPNLDLNVNNYTITDLLIILDLNAENLSEDTVTEKTNEYMLQYSNDDNKDMVFFFKEIQDTLLEYINNSQDTSAEKQTNNWIQNQSLDQSNPIQQDKITDRVQQIEIYNNKHVPMKQKQLGVTNTFSVPVVQDKLNPNLENITKRFINLDSKYRQINGLNNESTDYTCDLSDPLSNVISLKLYSFQIPCSWYSIDITKNCFWISFVNPDGSFYIFPNTKKPGICISIESGNYDPVSFTNALNTILNSLFTFSNLTPVTYSTINGKITMQLLGGIYSNDTSLIISTTSVITFFDINGIMSCSSVCAVTAKLNNSLGWLMGYRNSQETVQNTGNIANAVLDLYGPKYLIIVLDDYNQNHINSGLIGITEYSKVLDLPSYYSPAMLHTCIPATSPLIDSYQQDESDLLLLDKLNVTYSPTMQVIPTAPRTLTQTQIYSINEILKNNNNNTNNRLLAPTSTDTFAIIPIKGNMKLGDVYTDYSGSLQDNKRIYFGPVSIDRIHVKLLDDKGNLLNLNGLDWSITLISENLYQY
jgi:hypothetical protein